MHFEVRRNIARRPQDIWPLLVNRDVLVNGGFGILRIDGDIAPGGRLKLWSEASPKRAFALRVREFAPPSRMVWDGGMPLGLFRGVRVYGLTETSAGSLFHMREDYSGLLLGLIGKSIPDLTRYFEKFADALKRRAEGAA